MLTQEEQEKRILAERHKVWLKHAKPKYRQLREGRSRRHAYWRSMLEWDNVKLLDELCMMAGGDDYDGCFTVEGERNYRWMRKLMEYRIKQLEEQTVKEVNDEQH